MMDEAKAKWAELDEDQSGVLEGSEIERFGKFIKDKVQSILAEHADPVREQRDLTQASKMLERCETGVEISWEEFKTWFTKLQTGQWGDIDHLYGELSEAWSNADNSTPATTGQLTGLLEVLMKVNERLEAVDRRLTRLDERVIASSGISSGAVVAPYGFVGEAPIDPPSTMADGAKVQRFASSAPDGGMRERSGANAGRTSDAGPGAGRSSTSSRSFGDAHKLV